MELKEYRAMPDEGMFEKIEHRLVRRRLMRWGGVAVGVAVVAAAAVMWLMPRATELQGNQVTESLGDQVAESLGNQVPESSSHPATLSSIRATESPSHPVTQSPIIHNVVTLAVVSDEPRPIQAQQKTEHPSLPPASIVPEVMEVTDLILEEPMGGDSTVAATSPAKSGEPVPESPHYDNILWAPNILAPMAEDAADREFKVQATSVITHFQLVIYNRGGRRVFSTNDPAQGWDARNGGSYVPQGTYVWVARFRDTDGVLRQEKGTVTVVL